MPIESEKEESEQEIDEQPEPLRRSQRESRPPVRYGIDEFTNTANVTSHMAYQAVKIEEPNTINDALNSDYSQEWKKVATQGNNVVGCKWVFRVNMMVMVKSSVLKADLSLKGSHHVMVLIMKNFFLQLHICDPICKNLA